jgi:hypothetical protein
MKVLAAQGIPNDQLGAASASVARQLGIDPTAPIDLNDPQVRNVLVPAVAQLKKMGIGQVAQAGQPPVQEIPPLIRSRTKARLGRLLLLQPAARFRLAWTRKFKSRSRPIPRSRQTRLILKPVQEAALTRLRALQEAGQPTGPIKEYDLYRRQGGDMPFKDFLADLESGKAGATERAKSEVKEQQDYISQGRMAQQRLQTLNTISNIVGTDKNLNLGFGSETSLKVKMALEQAGFDFGDLSGVAAYPEAERRAGLGILQVVQHQADPIRVQDVPGEQPRPCLGRKGQCSDARHPVSECQA